MTVENISMLLTAYDGKIAQDKLCIIKSKLANVADERFDELEAVKLKKPFYL